jgi:hypothetical protein
MKKFFSIFAILSLAFSFGCGGGEEKKEEGKDKPAEEKPAEEKPAE